VKRHYLGFLAAIGAGYLLSFVRPEGRMRWPDVAACALVAACAGQGVADPFGTTLVTVATFSAMILAVAAVRSGKGHWLTALAIACVISAAAWMLIPSLSKSRAIAAAESALDRGVSVLDRRLVGIFQTAIIASPDPKALQVWLHENGFATSTNSDPVIEDYVQEGWVFVATKVRRDHTDRNSSTPHPLSFTFKTEKPVYPMRLTGVDNGPLRVELYVFAPERAKARHFKVERCTRPDYPELQPYWSRRLPKRPAIVHPLLREWVEGAPVATKLTALLTPARMRQDVWIEWKPYAEKRSLLFSPAGARTTALNYASGFVAATLLLAGIGTRIAGTHQRLLPKWSVYFVLLGTTLAGAVYWALPRTEVRLVKNPSVATQNALYYFYSWLNHTGAGLDEIRTEADRLLADSADAPQRAFYGRNSHRRYTENFLLGGRLREEDSPGNYTLRQKGKRIEFVAYDAQGKEHVLGELELVPEDTTVRP
jgi:hypothetical protein